MSVSACITSISGPILLAEERAFLRAAQPWGVILMGRSCLNRAQVRALVLDIREALGRHALIFIDQEGGRVARLRSPEWPKFPSAGLFGKLFDLSPEKAEEACFLSHRLMGQELSELGITADCAPCCDLRQTDTHDAIGDRAFGFSVDVVTRLASAAITGLSDAGVGAVIKHMPGQGRATMDSHYDLPMVMTSEERLLEDLSIFQNLAPAVAMGMTGHVVFDAFDPELAATISPTVISEMIRKRIGFEGLLMTDDLGMNALGGKLYERGEKALSAGCDVLLHCSGFLKDPAEILAEMEEVASAAGHLSGTSAARAEWASNSAGNGVDCDLEQASERLNELMSELGTKA